MPYVVRYLEARSPQRPYLALTKEGEWGTSTENRASRFPTKLAAEKAIDKFIDAHPGFALEVRPRRHFVLDTINDFGHVTSKKDPPKPPKTIWDRLLEDD